LKGKSFPHRRKKKCGKGGGDQSTSRGTSKNWKWHEDQENQKKNLKETRKVREDDKGK